MLVWTAICRPNISEANILVLVLLSVIRFGRGLNRILGNLVVILFLLSKANVVSASIICLILYNDRAGQFDPWRCLSCRDLDIS